MLPQKFIICTLQIKDPKIEILWLLFNLYQYFVKIIIITWEKLCKLQVMMTSKT